MKNILIIGVSLFFMGCSSLITRGDLRRCQAECSEMGRDMKTVRVKEGKKDCSCTKGPSHLNEFDKKELETEGKMQVGPLDCWSCLKTPEDRERNTIIFKNSDLEICR